MKKRKGSLLQRMMAVLLSAVLVVSMAFNDVSMTVLAQESTESLTPDEQQENAEENTADTVEGDEEQKEETDSNAAVIAAFAPLKEEIKAQTVPVGTALEALRLPGELTVYLAEEAVGEKNEDTDDAEEKNEDADDAEEKNEDVGDAEEKNEDVGDTGEKNEDASDVEEKNEDADVTEEEDDGEGESGSGNAQEGTEQEDAATENGGNEEEPDAGTDETGLTQETFIVELPEYHAENALAVQTLEQKEPVTIGGVTWQAEPEYDGETEGLYLFTAVLPDGYALAEDVELPDIAVTVKDDMSIMKKAAVMRQAAETHRHPVCGASCGHSGETHPEVEWTPLTQDSITGDSGSISINGKNYDCYNLSAGNYYLTEDISIDKILKTSGEVSLCFNGHTITSTLKGTNNNIGSLIVYYNFNACDCGSGGAFTNNGQYVLISRGTTNLYGGRFSGSYVVQVNLDTFTLDGATLEATVAAVDIQSACKGFIKSGSATSSGRSTIDIYTMRFTMSGGTVTNTKYDGKALSFSYDKAGTITGGTITALGSSGTGVEILNRASVVLSGNPAISGGGADISVAGNSKITATDLTGKYGISYAFTTNNITEAAPAAFTVDAPNDYSEYFTESDALKNSGLALHQTSASGNEQTVEIYRPHKLTHFAEVPATCTADGTGEYWKCTNKDCGKMFSDADGKTEIYVIPVKDALGHNEEGNVAHKDPTCTEAGVQGGIYCTRCEEGKAEAEAVIPATGHKYHWTITKTPTMTAEGTAAGVCGNDSSHEETKTLPVLTDTTVWTVGDKVEPTKDRDGSQAYISEYGTVTVMFPSYAKRAAAAKEIVEEALSGITATNTTTKESVQSAIDAALDEAGKTNVDIAGVTVTVGEFTKTEATASAAGSIRGSITISCGEGTDIATDSVSLDKPIAQLTAGKYTVAVNNGTGGGEYAVGATVTITANAPASGQQFDKWTVNSGSVTLANAASSTTTFTMPAEAVSVTATYKTNTEGGSGDSGSGDHSGDGGSSGGNSDHSGSNGNSGSGNNNNDIGGESDNNGGSGSSGGNDITDGGGYSGANGNNITNTPAKVPTIVITTQPKNLEDAVLTEPEKQQKAAGADIRIELDVKVVTAEASAADRALVEEALRSSAAGYTLGQYLDISLYKVIGDSRTAIRETDGKITIRIDVPDALKNTDGSRVRTFAVIRVHDGRTEFLADLDTDNDTITIETDRFSTYAVIYKDTADGGNGGSIQLSAESGSGKGSGGAKDNEPKTGDATPLELSATLAMIAGFAYLLLYFADRERGMTEERKKELVSQLVGWAKRGGRIRKYLALAAIFVLLVYYHSIGKKTCTEWKAIYGE